MDERKLAEAWRVMRIQSELVDGIEKLIKLGHAVSIYGSARLGPDSPYYQLAQRLGQMFSARGLINATGTWESPYIPDYPGRDSFLGRQLHTRDYRTPQEFAGKTVLIVGGGISAIQLLDEISRVTRTIWVTRRPPAFREGPFDENAGRAAVAIVEDRVRRGLPPGSVVSVTGLPVTPATSRSISRAMHTFWKADEPPTAKP